MVDVSPELKQAFNPNDGNGERVIDYSLVFYVVNNEAQAEAVPQVPAEQQASEISRAVQITDGQSTPIKFVTFETSGWPLDGSGCVPPRVNEASGAEIGLVMNDLSDENREFEDTQNITITTPSKHNLLGLILDWGDSVACDFQVDFWSDNAIVHTVQVTGNTKSSFKNDWAVQDVNKVVVHVSKTALPYRRVRLCEITFGSIKTYNKANSGTLTISESIDPMNERVPANELKMSVDNFAREYNIFDPTGVYAYFQDRQVMEPSIGAMKEDGTFEYIPMGRYYLRKPKLSGNLSKLEFTAVDALGQLQDTTYSKGHYMSGSMFQFVSGIASDAGVRVVHPLSFIVIPVHSYIPSVSHADALRMIAQATNTVLSANRRGEIEFASLGEDSIMELTCYDYRMNNGFSPSDDEPYNAVKVEYMNVRAGSQAEVLATATGTGTLYISYDPSTNHSFTIDGGELQSAEFYVDNAVLTITGGTVTISGKKLIIDKNSLVKSAARPGEQLYIKEIKGNPFIDASRAEKVADYALRMIAQKRRIVQISYRGYPYLEMGDIVRYNTGEYTTAPFFITKSTFNLNGGMTGTLESRER